MTLSLTQPAVRRVEDALPSATGLTASELRRRMHGSCAQESVRAILRFLVRHGRAIADDTSGARRFRRAQ